MKHTKKQTLKSKIGNKLASLCKHIGVGLMLLAIMMGATALYTPDVQASLEMPAAKDQMISFGQQVEGESTFDKALQSYQEELGVDSFPVLETTNVIDAAGETNSSEETQKYIANLVNTIIMILRVMYAMLLPIVVIIGKFMSNDWVTGSIFNIDLIIEVIWQLVRNAVNVLIVFYLLYIAARNIVPFGNAKDSADVKKTLPKIAIALIIVNFSLFFCRTVLSAANVATTAAFSMPQTVGKGVFETSEFLQGYNPFIWASPIGKKVKIPVAGGGTISQTAGQDAYYIECLHRNYMLDFKSGTFSDGEAKPFIVKNPGFDANGRLITNDVQNAYRMVIISTPEDIVANLKQKSGSITANAGMQVFATNSVEHDAIAKWKQKETEINADSSIPSWDKPVKLQEWINNLPAEESSAINNFQAHGGTTQNVGSFPYYSDCILSWDELAFSSRNAMFAFAFNLLKIPEYESALGSVNTFWDITIRVALSVVFLALFFLINIGMLLAMVMRGVWIWVMMAASPIWFMIDTLKVFKDNKTKDTIGSFSRFTALAFMPAVVGIVLSLGFMMIHYLKYIGTIDGSSVGRIVMGSINIFYDASTPIIGGVGSFFDMIFALMSIAVIWVGVFAAFKFGFGDNAIYKNTIGKVEDFGKTVGTAAAKYPLHMRAIPTPKGMVSLASLSKGSDVMKSKINEIYNKKTREDISKFFPGDKEKLSEEKLDTLKTGTKNAADIKELNKVIQKTGFNTIQEHDMMHQTFEKIKDYKGGDVKIDLMHSGGEVVIPSAVMFEIQKKYLSLSTTQQKEFHKTLEEADKYIRKSDSTGSRNRMEILTHTLLGTKFEGGGTSKDEGKKAPSITLNVNNKTISVNKDGSKKKDIIFKSSDKFTIAALNADGTQADQKEITSYEELFSFLNKNESHSYSEADSKKIIEALLKISKEIDKDDRDAETFKHLLRGYGITSMKLHESADVQTATSDAQDVKDPVEAALKDFRKGNESTS